MDVRYPLRYDHGILQTVTEESETLYSWIRSLLHTFRGERDDDAIGIDPGIFFEPGIPSLIKEESTRVFSLIPELRGEIKIVGVKDGAVQLEVLIAAEGSSSATRLATRIDLGEF
ncbi:hypothetical protein [Moorena sp. SIO3A2]|uniref:hypothetical protein n=1 Tax=Moorena sp. SIO3A2 TaxID=2607841 RepID=UPI0013B72E20|nr:hypothetical protein [Moorena sp. SIO3A2]NER90368.1 hypothetical protein [Moorena sp. SIO3A2]